jgi:hypothetical protein
VLSTTSPTTCPNQAGLCDAYSFPVQPWVRALLNTTLGVHSIDRYASLYNIQVVPPLYTSLSFETAAEWLDAFSRHLTWSSQATLQNNWIHLLCPLTGQVLLHLPLCQARDTTYVQDLLQVGTNSAPAQLTHPAVTLSQSCSLDLLCTSSVPLLILNMVLPFFPTRPSSLFIFLDQSPVRPANCSSPSWTRTGRYPCLAPRNSLTNLRQSFLVYRFPSPISFPILPMSDPASSGDSQTKIVDIPIPAPVSRAPNPPTGGQQRATTTQPTKALPLIPKRRALTVAALRDAATAVAHPNLLVGQAHAANLAEYDQDTEDLGQKLARAYAEIARLQQYGAADPTGFYLDQDDPQIIGEANSFLKAPDTSRPALSSAAVQPPPPYVTPGPSAAPYTAHPAGVLGLPSRPLSYGLGRGCVPAPPGGPALMLVPTPTGGLPHASQTQGQISVLLNNSSYTNYCQTHPTEGRIIALAISLRDLLMVSHTRATNALEGSEDLSDYPLFGNMVQLAHGVDSCIHQTNDLVNAVSQKMLFDSRQISHELTVLHEDLELHNILNPDHQINMKQFKELLDMSKRVDRQTTQAEFCPWLGENAPWHGP